MSKSLKIGVMGIDHGHIFDMLDEMTKEGCNCNHFWTEGSPLTLKEFNKKYPNIKRTENIGSEKKWMNKDHALFVGYMPSEKPRYSLSVVIEHGGSGASTAAPIAKDVFEFIKDTI